MAAPILKHYSVSPKAESVVNIIAGIFLWSGIILTAVAIAAGLVIVFSLEETWGWAVVAGSIFLPISGIINWAFLKVFVNMSRSLYNIEERLGVVNREMSVENRLGVEG